MVKVASIGEVLIELSPSAQTDSAGRELYALSYAGDTFNTAVYLARLGGNVDYVTLLGDDRHSDRILQVLREEGVGTGLVRRLPGRSPGLYLIHNDVTGEREFQYWRGQAPARELFSDEDNCGALQQFDVLYLSGITLAIISTAARRRLAKFLRRYRDGGGKVVFDSNYRPGLWRDRESAAAATELLLRQTDIALLTLEDEQSLWQLGDTDALLEFYRQCGIEELVLKRGAEPVLLQYVGRSTEVPVPPVSKVVDTTGAGDAFNAGYLATRLRAAEPTAAVAAGIRLAGIVIGHRGAIVDRSLVA